MTGFIYLPYFFTLLHILKALEFWQCLAFLGFQGFLEFLEAHGFPGFLEILEFLGFLEILGVLGVLIFFEFLGVLGFLGFLEFLGFLGLLGFLRFVRFLEIPEMRFACFKRISQVSCCIDRFLCIYAKRLVFLLVIEFQSSSRVQNSRNSDTAELKNIEQLVLNMFIIVNDISKTDLWAFHGSPRTTNPNSFTRFGNICVFCGTVPMEYSSCQCVILLFNNTPYMLLRQSQ
jgi:hypothetical protein